MLALRDDSLLTRPMESETLLTTMHWGTYDVRAENGRLVGVEPWSGDPDPSPIGKSMLGTVQGLIAGVAQLPTGAWFDPSEPGQPHGLEKHGNPNVLTPDRGTSRLAQSPTCNSTLVQVSRFDEAVPRVTAFDPPATVRLADVSGIAGHKALQKEA
jgi:hypothetical protein